MLTIDEIKRVVTKIGKKYGIKSVLDSADVDVLTIVNRLLSNSTRIF